MNDKEIKVNEYVRLDDGIIGKVIPYDNGIKIKITEIDTWKPTIESIKKHSFNIIDLIEVGDYVNGCLVLQKYEPNDLWEPIEIRVDSKTIKYFIDGEIKSIVTKEQFENAEYKVEE